MPEAKREILKENVRNSLEIRVIVESHSAFRRPPDASGSGVGTVLSQVRRGKERPVTFLKPYIDKNTK